jgi:C-terminal processing protease CtpA/Prc
VSGAVDRHLRAARLAAIGLLLLAAGCGSAARVLVSAGGDVRRCPPRGAAECVAAATAAGYVEQEEIGGIGVTVAESAEPGRGLRVLWVIAGSPAARAGIAPGDYLIRIAGQEPRGKREARMLMFGRAGTKVELTVRKGGRTAKMALVREPLEGLRRGAE